jgi:parallel beta-helix repeat protein
LTACLPGKGKDYQVGSQSGQIAELDQVPWASLAAGDTVRIHYRATPYRGKFQISASGTAAAPVRICGVKSASGQRPIIDGQNAVTTRGLDYGDSANTEYVHQKRAIIQVKQLGSTWTAYPSNIQIDGLEVRGATPANTFTDATGVVRNYVAFGACIWVNRGHNITIADNVIHDCTQGIYTKSTDDGDFAITKNIRIAGNYIYGNGVVGDDHMHNTYTASQGVVFEFNRYGPLRSGALGNTIKDRSIGTVVRYNYLQGGARALDLVEAEDFPIAAKASPAYRSTYVYGNQIVKDGSTGSAIHYGGDHFGSTPTSSWGEPNFRQGTLYFYNNTMRITGTGSTAVLFQLSTTLERAEVWNNVFTFDSTVTYAAMRSNQEVNSAYWTGGGIVNLGRNWINSRWADSDPWHPVSGQLLGQSNLITGTTAPINSTTLAPLASSAILNVGLALTSLSSTISAAVTAHPVTYQLNSSFLPVARTVKGIAPDLGAIEY